MPTTDQPPTAAPPPTSESRRIRLFNRFPWLPLVFPMAVYMVLGLLEPEIKHPPVAGGNPEPFRATAADDGWQASDGYALAYSCRAGLTLAAILWVLPFYRQLKFHVHWIAVGVGLAGGLIWVGVCRIGLEQRLIASWGLSGWLSLGGRPAFNPLAAFADSTSLLVLFLTVRFTGLVVLVPVLEEFFLRGFLMRFFLRAEWWTIPWGTVTPWAAVIATLYGVLAHPAEPVAAAIWFSLITLLYARTRNIWDCVAAHAVTNLVLGCYVMASRDWTLW